jgi:hypothetical protein
MPIIVCEISPSVNPYVVLTTNMVKSCPIHTTIDIETCRVCDNHVRERV